MAHSALRVLINRSCTAFTPLIHPPAFSLTMLPSFAQNAVRLQAIKAASSGATRRALTSTAALHSSLSSLTESRARDVEAKWSGTSTSGDTTKNFIDGSFVDSHAAQKWFDVRDPATQTLLSRVPDTDASEFDRAVASAQTAFEEWSETSVLGRQQIMFR